MPLPPMPTSPSQYSSNQYGTMGAWTSPQSAQEGWLKKFIQMLGEQNEGMPWAFSNGNINASLRNMMNALANATGMSPEQMSEESLAAAMNDPRVKQRMAKTLGMNIEAGKDAAQDYQAATGQSGGSQGGAAREALLKLVGAGEGTRQGDDILDNERLIQLGLRRDQKSNWMQQAGLFGDMVGQLGQGQLGFRGLQQRGNSQIAALMEMLFGMQQPQYAGMGASTFGQGAAFSPFQNNEMGPPNAQNPSSPVAPGGGSGGGGGSAPPVEEGPYDITHGGDSPDPGNQGTISIGASLFGTPTPTRPGLTGLSIVPGKKLSPGSQEYSFNQNRPQRVTTNMRSRYSGSVPLPPRPSMRGAYTRVTPISA